jgi:hypothetical protein
MRPIHISCALGALAAAMPLSLGCSTHGDPSSAESVASIEQAAGTDAGACPTQAPACDAGTSVCNLGIWPGGVIHYSWSDGGTDFSSDGGANINTPIRGAMNDWQTFSHGLITFVNSNTATPRVDISSAVSGGGEAPGYTACAGVDGGIGEVTLSYQDVYHELGHVIGLKHEWQRHDREHYAILSRTQHQEAPDCGYTVATTCTDPNNNAQCNSTTSVGMFGPYDYESTMQYYPTQPDITRWDGTPIVNRPENVSCSCGGIAGLWPPQCADSTCTTAVEAGANCSPLNDPTNSGEVMCPTCGSECTYVQPQGLPTKKDAAAVVELYQTTGLWSVFKRTIDDGGQTSPFDNTLAAGVTINPIDPTPAVETWEGGTLGIYVWGSDNQYYHKWKIITNGQFTGWSSWTPLTDGTFTSAPSVVSWGNGRTDIVGRGSDNAIWIKSYINGAWQFGWSSLGGKVASGPSIVSWGPNQLDVFARTTSNTLMVASCAGSCPGGSTGWGAFTTPFGTGTFKGKPAAVSRGTGYLDIFVHGMNDTLWATSYQNRNPGSWYSVVAGTLGWNSNVSADQYSPAVDARGTTLLDVFVRGEDDELWVTSWTGGSTWNAYFPQGGVLIAAPATVSKLRTTNHIDVVGVMGEETTAPPWVLDDAGVVDASASRPSLMPGVWLKTYN